MLTILTAVVCIHHICLTTIIPTPATLDERACIHLGYWIALKHVSPRWRIVDVECQEGRIA